MGAGDIALYGERAVMRIRKGFVLPLVIVVSVLVLFFLSLGFIIKIGLVKSLESVTKSEVTIQSVSVHYFPFELDIAGVQVSNPKQLHEDLLRFDTARVALSFSHFLNKQIIIDDVQVENLRFNSKREQPARLISTQAVSSKASNAKADDASQTGAATKSLFGQQPLFQLQTPELDAAQFTHTNAALDKVKQQQADFDSQLQALNEKASGEYKARFYALKTRFDALLASDINSVDDINRLKDEYKLIETDFKALKAELNAEYQASAAVLSDISASMSAVKLASKKDYKAISSQVSADNIKSMSLTNRILAPFFKKRLDKAKAYADMGLQAKAYVSLPKKPKKPFRQAGRTIHFSQKQALPTFLLRQLKASGDTVSIHIQDLSSDSKRYPFKAEATLRGIKGPNSVLDITLFQKSSTVYQSNIKLNGLAVENHSVFHDAAKQIHLSSADLSLNGEVIIDSSAYYGDFYIDLSQTQFDIVGFNRSNIVEKLIDTSLAKTKQLIVFVEFDTAANNFAVKSSFDRVLERAVSAEIAAEKARVKKSIKKQLDAYLSVENSAIQQKSAAQKAGLSTTQASSSQNFNEQEDKYKHKIDTAKDELLKKAADFLNISF